MASDFQNNVGLFVPTTNIWDVAGIKDMDVTKPEFKELIVRLYQNINNISMALNLKESAYYFPQEFLTSQAFFLNPNVVYTQNSLQRQAYRMVVIPGPLPNNATISVPHEINFTPSYSVTRIYGAATDQTGMSYLPLPYSSVSSMNNNIELSADSTYVYITTGSDRTAYVTTYVVVEYLKE